MKEKNTTRVLANEYSTVGTRQFLVAVYEEEAVVYGQVSAETAKLLSKGLSTLPTSVQVEPAEVSDDCLTYCWWLRRSKARRGRGDWLPLILSQIRVLLATDAPHLLEDGLDLMYVDNRHLDDNTVEQYARLLRSST